MARKIIQIAATGHSENQFTQCEYTLVALCDDGTVWSVGNRFNSGWVSWPPIPQDHRDA